jgi:Putative methyltransferase
MSRDWLKWHDIYDEVGSVAEARLLLVQRRIGEFLDSWESGSIVRVVSACAGQGRDLLPVLASYAGPRNVRARLLELDPRNARVAEETAREAALDGVEVVRGDASITDAYVGAVPADLILFCGVFGNVSDEDVRNTVELLPQLCAEGAVVIWTRHTWPPDLTPEIREWFASAGFREEAFDSPGSESFSVGVHRLVESPVPLEPGRRLFTFQYE